MTRITSKIDEPETSTYYGPLGIFSINASRKS